MILHHKSYVVCFDLEEDLVTLLKGCFSNYGIDLIHCRSFPEVESVLRRTVHQFAYITKDKNCVHPYSLNEGIPFVKFQQGLEWSSRNYSGNCFDSLFGFLCESHRPQNLKECLKRAVRLTSESFQLKRRFLLEEIYDYAYEATHSVKCAMISDDYIGKLNLLVHLDYWKAPSDGASLYDQLAEFGNCILGVVNREMTALGFESQLTMPEVSNKIEWNTVTPGPFLNELILADPEKLFTVSLGFVDLRRRGRLVFSEEGNPNEMEIEFL